MILHCPGCHAQFSIKLFTQDEAAREPQVSPEQHQ